jgi:glucose-1-phosphate thymidylyltransferase
VIEFSKSLKPSKRNETEIVDLLKKYKSRKQLSAEIIGRGGTWLDAGSIKDFNNTSNFVATIENRQGFKIGCIEEIALNNSWINKEKIKNIISFYGNCEYSKYLNSIINK